MKGKDMPSPGRYDICPLCGTRSMFRFKVGATQGCRYRCMNPAHAINARKAKRRAQKRRRRRERREKK
jgi:hypothetical protein